MDVEVKSQVFQCCNIWEDFVTADNTLTEAVSEFLSDNNIPFSEMETIDNGPSSVCASCCKCPAGMEVKFKVDEEDLQILLDLGFEQ